MIAVYLNIHRRLSFRAPQLIGQEQLTANDQEKDGLLTDGKTLYFGQEQDGWFALAAMPVDGGPIRVLWSPKANVLPVDISPDDRKLLVLTSVGVETERELWVVSLDKGEQRHLANIAAHSAAWAPDSKTIAYAAGNGIYLTSEDETAPKEVGSFTSLPRALFWSQDGQRLRFVLEDIPTQVVKSWGQLAGDGMGTITLHPLPTAINAGRDWTRAAGNDAYFVTSEASHLGGTRVWLVQYGKRWWEPALHVSQIGLVQGYVGGISFVGESSRLFVLSEPHTRVTFTRFDPHIQAFRTILPGASGMFLDYSRDGKWVTYTSFLDGTLWVSRADGRSARQVTFPTETVELPRWSPDGKQIAYMAQRPDQPWRIYILNLDTGATREASEGDDSQGAPTWSPDGRFLAYGNVKCEHTHSCAIHRIDLSTGKVHTLPGSEGLFTARWSPDGRSIVALHLDQHELMLFNVKTGKWRKLADAIDGTDLSWSANSKYIYTNIPGADARIVRIRATDGHQETVLDLDSQDKFNLANTNDMQFSLAPDDSVVLHRPIHSEEIYAYDLRER